MVTLEGHTIVGETAKRDIRVCGAGAFVVLKALAFHIRGENKDAYDLFYLLRNYASGVPDVAAELRPLLADESAVKALEYLRADFEEINSIGPRRVAEFLGLFRATGFEGLIDMQHEVQAVRVLQVPANSLLLQREFDFVFRKDLHDGYPNFGESEREGRLVPVVAVKYESVWIHHDGSGLQEAIQRMLSFTFSTISGSSRNMFLMTG